MRLMGKANDDILSVFRGTERRAASRWEPPWEHWGQEGFRSGRKPNAFRDLCTQILQDPEIQERIREAANDATSPGWVSLLKLLASYAVGPPTPMAEIEGSGEEFRFTLDFDGARKEIDRPQAT
jgi:hypothetical protein